MNIKIIVIAIGANQKEIETNNKEYERRNNETKRNI